MFNPALLFSALGENTVVKSMEILWLANKRAFPAKIRTKVLINLGNQKAKKA